MDLKKRIWELDALRGAFLLIMIAVHITYDLTELMCIVTLKDTRLYDFFRDQAGVLFLLLSGICATLGSKPVKRGLQVLAGAACVTIVTVGMAALGLAGPEIRIWFGVLHCLGMCMLLWPLSRKLPTVGRLLLGIGIILLGGYLLDHLRVDTYLLIPFGIVPRHFASSDYFPLLPHFGWFLIGSVLGQTLYRQRQSLLPDKWSRNPVSRSLMWMGRHSLIIYLLHQPVIYAVIYLYTLGRT